MYPSIRLPFLPYDWASVSLYFLAIALGFGCAAFLMWRHARDYDIDQDRFADFIIWMLIMGVLGSRLMHVLADGFLMDYVNLCIDPMLLEGRALLIDDQETLAGLHGQAVQHHALRGLNIGLVGLHAPQTADDLRHDEARCASLPHSSKHGRFGPLTRGKHRSGSPRQGHRGQKGLNRRGGASDGEPSP